MNTEGLLDELMQLLEKAGVEVRVDAMGGGGGGVCSVRGRNIVFLDSQGATMERAAVCARALARTVDLEQIYMRPEVRQFVEREVERSS